MNPCPCRYYGDTDHQCTCSLSMVSRYQADVRHPPSSFVSLDSLRFLRGHSGQATPAGQVPVRCWTRPNLRIGGHPQRVVLGRGWLEQRDEKLSHERLGECCRATMPEMKALHRSWEFVRKSRALSGARAQAWTYDPWCLPLGEAALPGASHARGHLGWGSRRQSWPVLDALGQSKSTVE